jgi:formylglycine-generating enzyme required for sulfatase activity/DNA-binding CsgD family transcriptional regulator
MANKENIYLLSKYQMKVLYYKSKEGATHEEIAEILGRDVNTIQYHMTKIYKILEITGPGKSKEEMDSELKNEICPIIRQMFQSIDDIKTWAPSTKKSLEQNRDELAPAYQPPPSLETVLKQAENQRVNPEIIATPPPGRPRVNGRRVIPWLVLGLLLFAGWRLILHMTAAPQRPADTPTQPDATQTLIPRVFAVIQSSTPTRTITFTPQPSATSTAIPAPTEIITQMSVRDGMVLVYVAAGEFKMGSARGEDPQTLDEETPQHIVYLDEYWIDQTEVTNAQYARCVEDGGACTEPEESGSLTHSVYYANDQFANYPVIFVSWSQASAYCSWAGRRLPTEAEWEKAARGVAGFIFPWGNIFDGSKANYCDINCVNGWKDTMYDDGYIDTSPVGDFPEGASIYGVFDMAGNVYEWVANWYEPYSRLRQVNPVGPLSGTEHVIRGGSWGDDSAHIRTAIRSHSNLPGSSNFIGFRCVK